MIYKLILNWGNKVNWYNLIENILISLFSASLFWLLTFKCSLTDVTFSQKLEKSKSALGLPYHRYRVRIGNFGFRDLIEVSVVARLTIKVGDSSCVSNLAIGNQGFLPILRHYPIFSYNTSWIHTLTISPAESTRRELSKRFYTKRIQKLAKKGKISLDDIFAEYGDKVSIRVYLYGNDRATGARRLFISPVYTKDRLGEGRFSNTRNIRFSPFDSREVKEEKISQIKPVDI